MKKINLALIALLILVGVIGIRLIWHSPIPSSEPSSESLSRLFTSSLEGFSLQYPAGFSVKEGYEYQNLGPGRDIGGVKFVISTSTSIGTNLGSDTYLSVEQISQVKDCSASLFLYDSPRATLYTSNGVAYSLASTTGAGAGNRYEEWVYALSGTHPCFAVRYFIHYSVIENYPPGAVKEFDQAALLKQFDAIRHSLILL